MKHAIIGCGRAALSHADAFARLGNLDFDCAVDIEPEQAESLARQYGAARTATDYREVLQDPTITSVSLCTPHDLHAPMTLEAVAHGKHVLVEKPFVLRVDDGRRVIAAAEDCGLVVMPVAQHRFDRPVRLVNELIRSGVLGPLRFVRCHLECARSAEYYADSPWRGSWIREGGSVLINQAYHIVDLLLWLCGTPQRVSAGMSTFASDIMETEDTLTASLTFANGALGGLTVCGSAGAEWRSLIELIAADGAIAFDIAYPNQIFRLEMNNRRELRSWKKRFAEVTQTVALPTPGVAYYGITHRDQAEGFVESIGGRAPEGCADLEQSLRAVEFIQAVYGAARSGEAVKLFKAESPTSGVTK